MTRRPALRDQVATMIVERAAAVRAARGDAVSMAEFADAAGVGRTTLYRYFPNREALYAAMFDAALDDLFARVEEAGLDRVPVREAIARLARAFIANGRYATLVHDELAACRRADEVERRLTTPMREVLERGIESGVLRSDLTVETMLAVSRPLLEAGIAMAAAVGGEQASAVMTSIFLDGISADPQMG
ncbi:TetR/AcrR family transcriptional regulator [Nocardia macrotermitis]|nr:TetR/AcrR family transcriptional regulator [Nocardia macrotermitis]